MATVTIYGQSANDGAAHVAVFGATLAAGGGAGTEGSPYATWSAVAAVIEDVATNHSADDLVVNLHPAFIALGGAVNAFETMASLGRGNSWRSVTIQRWQAKIDADPRYADWTWTICTLQPITAWTQGSVSGGVWTAGPGDVYRTTSTLAIANAPSPMEIKVYAGVDRKDGRGTRPQVMSFADLALMTDEGDYCLTGSSGAIHIYVKTGQAGVDPVTRWGGECCYATANSHGYIGLLMRDCKNLTVSDPQVVGGCLYAQGFTAGLAHENIRFVRPRTRGNVGFGCRVSTTGDNYYADGECIEPDFDTWAAPRRVRSTTYSGSAGAQNGMHLLGKIKSFPITNPKIAGHSHGNLAFEASEYRHNRHYIMDAAVLSAQNTFTNQFADEDGATFGVRVVETDSDMLYIRLTVGGTYTGTITLQYSTNGTSGWTDMGDYTAGSYDVVATSGRWYRAGFKTGNYTSGSAIVSVAHVPVYVDGLPNDAWGAGIGGIRTLLSRVTGTFGGTLAIETADTSGGSYTSQQSLAAAGDVVFNDRLAVVKYARMSAAGLTSGAVRARLYQLAWPRNIEVRVTDYSNGKSTLTGAPDTSQGEAFCDYQRGIGVAGVNITIGPLKVRNQTTQSQCSGFVDFRGVDWDDSCIAYTDPIGSANYNVGHHLSVGPGAWGRWLPLQRIRLIGTKHDLIGGFAAYWNQQVQAGNIEVLGALVRDSGHVRYRPQRSNATDAAQTRRRTPFAGIPSGSPLEGQPQTIQKTIFILGPGCEGIAARRLLGSSPAEGANAVESNYPVIDAADAGASPWGGGYISGNAATTAAAAGFDDNLAYIGARQTPVQTGARRGRGYR